MLNNEKRIEAALIKLNEINKELSRLCDESSYIGTYHIEFARTFNKYKMVEGKPPSDETAKNLALADPEIEEVVRKYYANKFKADLWVEISRNIRRELDAIKGAIQEDVATNGMFS